MLLGIRYISSLFLPTVISEKTPTKISTIINWFSLVSGYSLIFSLSSYFCIFWFFPLNSYKMFKSGKIMPFELWKHRYVPNMLGNYDRLTSIVISRGEDSKKNTC